MSYSDDDLLQLLNGLTERTLAGAIAWLEADLPDTFVYSNPGGSVSVAGSGQGITESSIAMASRPQRYLLEVTDSDGVLRVQRSAGAGLSLRAVAMNDPVGVQIKVLFDVVRETFGGRTAEVAKDILRHLPE